MKSKGGGTPKAIFFEEKPMGCSKRLQQKRMCLELHH